MSIDAPTIRAAAIGKLRGGGYTIREAVIEAAREDTTLDQPQRDFITELLAAGLDRHDCCVSCSGTLIGAERAFGTCGQCGGRAKAIA